MAVSSNHSDTTLRCVVCEGRLAPSPIEIEGIEGQVYQCRECGSYWFLRKFRARSIMERMEVQK
jgi:uncharacterized protein with PIN domain